MPALPRRRFLELASAGLASRGRLAGDTAPPYGSPRLTGVTPTGATIAWHLPHGADIKLHWNCGEGWETAVAKRRWVNPERDSHSAPYHHYRVRLEGLPEGALVRYRIEGSEEAEYRARLPVARAGNWKVVAFGDSGAGSAEQMLLAELMAREDADLVLHTGDLAYPWSTPWLLNEYYFRCYAPMMAACEFCPALGNHDTAWRQGSAVLEAYELPVAEGLAGVDRGRYYAVERGGVRFFALDTNETLDGWGAGAMLSWLHRQLMTAETFWEVVFFHHPPWPSAKHRNDPRCANVRELVAPLIRNHAPALVLTGHDHLYARTAIEAARTAWVTTGGGGAWLYPAETVEPIVFNRSVYHYVRLEFKPWRLTVSAVDVQGEVFDRFEIAPRPQVTGLTWEGDSTLHITGRYLAEASEHRTVVEWRGARVEVVAARPRRLSLRLPAGVSLAGELLVTTPNGSARVAVTRPNL